MAAYAAFQQQLEELSQINAELLRGEKSSPNLELPHLSFCKRAVLSRCVNPAFLTVRDAIPEKGYHFSLPCCHDPLFSAACIR
jgi:hypothetical protein